MGNTLSWLNPFASANASILMLGLDAAGKTTMLYKIYNQYPLPPSISFPVETFMYKNMHVITWTPIQEKAYNMLIPYFPSTRGIIFVIDATDKERIEEAKELLHKILAEDELKNKPLLVYANKQDLLLKLSPSDTNPQQLQIESQANITELFGLNQIKSRKWLVQPSSAITGMGIYEGLDWLSNSL